MRLASRRGSVLAVSIAVAMVLTVAAWFAVERDSRPSETKREDPLLYEVVEGMVSRIVPSRVQIDDPSVLDLAITDGRITRMTIGDGEVVHFHTGMIAPVTVDESPSFLIAGEIPMWRDLQQGDTGTDVSQFQAFLVESGYELGRVDGEFGAATAAAVQAWREDVGLPEQAGIRQWEILFVPRTTQRIRVVAGLQVGQSVARQEPLLQLLGDEPRLFLDLPRALAGEVTIGDRVTVASHSCSLLVSGVGRSDELTDSVRVGLEPSSIHSSECSELMKSADTTSSASFAAKIHIVPTEYGPLLPTSAIRIGDGTTVVELADGTVVEVRIRATDGATAIVDGVAPGELVVVHRGG